MKHLIFLFVDHFEPRTPEEMDAWVREYPRVTRPFIDSGGRYPQHTWFYDGDDPRVLDELGRLCKMRLGEVEVHLHHSHDTAETLREKLEARKRQWAEHGALITKDGKSIFGVIHGKWSLDNSRGDEHCGVNNELIVLCEAGCYADFTFPAWGRMQPAKRQCIYYAADDPQKPKSYSTGVDVEVGKTPSGDLMIFQGPGRVSGVPKSFTRVPGLPWLLDKVFLTCAVDGHLPPTPDRIDRWVEANVCVHGQPDWVFVKVHTHGARPDNFGPYFGHAAQQLHFHLCNRYNNGLDWRLHYVTAREAYNMVKAAEVGRTGDPEAFRDFVIGPYKNTL